MSEKETKRKLNMEWYRLKPSDIIKDDIPKEFLKKRFRDKNKNGDVF